MSTGKQTIPVHIQQEAIEWLARLNTSDVSAAQEQAFFAWLAQSPVHQAAYLSAEQLWQRGEVLARVPVRTRANWRWVALPVLATACLLVIAIFLSPLGNNHSEVLYETAIGEQKTIQLEDGSSIELNTASKITVSFDQGKRTANLEQGEVFFDVTKDSARPFDVITPTGQIRVVGTRFVVRQLPGDALVSVQEGAVALGAIPATQQNFVASGLVKANQRLAISAAIKGEEPQAIDSAALAWRKRQLVFREQSLATVIADLQRYFPVRIELADAHIADMQVTAVIRLQDLPATLATLTEPLGLQAEIDPANARVLIRAK